jgi:hypothetical protein
MIELSLCLVVALIWYNSNQWQREVKKVKGVTNDRMD